MVKWGHWTRHISRLNSELNFADEFHSIWQKIQDLSCVSKKDWNKKVCLFSVQIKILRWSFDFNWSRITRSFNLIILFLLISITELSIHVKVQTTKKSFCWATDIYVQIPPICPGSTVCLLQIETENILEYWSNSSTNYKPCSINVKFILILFGSNFSTSVSSIHVIVGFVEMFQVWFVIAIKCLWHCPRQITWNSINSQPIIISSSNTSLTFANADLIAW